MNDIFRYIYMCYIVDSCTTLVDPITKVDTGVTVGDRRRDGLHVGHPVGRVTSF